MRGKPFKTMMIVAIRPCKDDELFYDCVQIFTIWESFLLCLWSFSTLMWSLSTLCWKVCELVQTIAKRKLIQSHKKLVSYIHAQTKLTPTPYNPMYTQNPNIIQMCSRRKINLSPLLDPIVMQHIFTCLPLTPSMFWCLRRVNKAWFMFVGKSPPWNALEVVRINHKSYLQQLANSGTLGQSLQMHFEFELQALKICLDPIDLVYPTMYYNSKSDSSNVTFHI